VNVKDLQSFKDQSAQQIEFLSPPPKKKKRTDSELLDTSSQ